MHLPTIGIVEGTIGDPSQLAKDFASRARLIWIPLEGLSQQVEIDALILGLQPLDRRLIEALSPTTRLIGRTGVGTDNIDLVAASERGISVFNEPGYGANEVATHALTLLLAAHTDLLGSDRFVREGWSGPFPASPRPPLDELRLGIVGYGRIGRALAQRAAPLVAHVSVYDVDPRNMVGLEGVEAASNLTDLLTQSDLLSLHVPLDDSTRGMIGEAEIALLPAGAVIVNVARGGIVDERALVQGLACGHVGGAGLDVFEVEPLPEASPLRRSPNVVMTPHWAAASTRSAWRLANWTIEDATHWLSERRLLHGELVA